MSQQRILSPTSGQAERKPPSITTSEPRHEPGFVRDKKCNGVCYFAWIAWALHHGPSENPRTKLRILEGEPRVSPIFDHTCDFASGRSAKIEKHLCAPLGVKNRFAQ